MTKRGAENPHLTSFIHTINADRKGHHVTGKTRSRLELGTKSRIYGPFFDAMLAEGEGLVKTGQVEPKQALSALVKAGTLFSWAELRNQNTLEGQELAEHQQNVLKGTVALVPKHAATKAGEGRAQVINAETVIGEEPGIEIVLAQIKYGAFYKPGTKIAETLKPDHRSTDRLVAEHRVKTMSHLSIFNRAIGETVGGIYHQMGTFFRPGQLRVIDLGSSYGATLEAITDSISRYQRIEGGPELAMTGIEPTLDFYKKLNGSEVNAMNVGLYRHSVKRGSNGLISEIGTFTTVHDDAVSVLKAKRLPPGLKHDVTVITANYSLSEFPSRSKEILLEQIAQNENVIFIAGDSSENTSILAKRFTNLTAFGPLTPGNRDLPKKLRDHGFSLLDPTSSRPSYIDHRIADRLAEERVHNDGHFWVAVKGDRARKALDTVRIGTSNTR